MQRNDMQSRRDFVRTIAWSAACLAVARAPSIGANNAGINRQSVRSADGTIISYARLGVGPAIVFSHESLESGAEWMQVATLLSDRFTCYVVDRRGRGKSGPAGNHSLAAECEDLRVVMEQAGPQATLMGASYGAIVAIETALRFGVDRLILYEPPLVLDADSPIARSLRESLEPYRKLVEAGSLDEALTYSLVSFAGVPAEVVGDIKSSSPDAWATMRELTPTWIPEMEAIKQMPLGIERYRALQMPILPAISARRRRWPGRRAARFAQIHAARPWPRRAFDRAGSTGRRHRGIPCGTG
jgi:pimeloyl-ACP methyl ester carboxylesterase